MFNSGATKRVDKKPFVLFGASLLVTSAAASLEDFGQITIYYNPLNAVPEGQEFRLQDQTYSRGENIRISHTATLATNMP